MTKRYDIAIFAAGCFWHVEEEFAKVIGITDTEVGYTGGNVKDPSYEQVSSGKTGHAEAIKIVFDPEKIIYSQLLDIFWRIHDPTSLNKQGEDIGTNYKSAIFYLNKQQHKEALQSKKDYGKIFKKPVVTEIKKAEVFYPAEEYHQRYFEKHQNIACKL